MDPTEKFPVEIMEKIFGNLRGKTLLNCTLVNREWNRQISTLSSCMAKLNLIVTESWKNLEPSERLEIVVNRRHRHVRIMTHPETSHFPLEFLSLEAGVKSLRKMFHRNRLESAPRTNLRIKSFRFSATQNELFLSSPKIHSFPFIASFQTR